MLKNYLEWIFIYIFESIKICFKGLYYFNHYYFIILLTVLLSYLENTHRYK